MICVAVFTLASSIVGFIMSRPLRRRRDRDSKHISIIVVQKRQVLERTSGAMIRSVQKAMQVDMAKRVAQNPQALLRKEECTKVQNYEMLKQSLKG